VQGRYVLTFDSKYFATHMLRSVVDGLVEQVQIQSFRSGAILMLTTVHRLLATFSFDQAFIMACGGMQVTQDQAK
jgi:hypothetical protein